MNKKYGIAAILAAVEKTLFNHLIGSLSEDGTDFAYYQATYGKKIYQTADYAYKCCRYRGVSAFAYLPEYLFYTSEEEIVPVVYAACAYEDDHVRVCERTDYPRSGEIVFELALKKPNRFRLRIPGWCGGYSVRLDGKETERTEFSLTAGEHEIRLDLFFSLRFEESEKEGYRKAYAYGPLLLAADGRESGFPLSSFLAGAGELPVKRGDRFFLRGTADGAEAELVLTDYSSAGRKNSEENEFLIWIPTEKEI